MKQWIVVVLASALVYGCSGNHSSQSAKSPSDVLALVDGKKVTRGEFDAYAKFKRLPLNDEKKAQEFLDQYLQRLTLVSAIEKSAKLDRAALDVEFNEFKREMMISRYFEKHLADAVSDDAVKNFYNSNAQKYEQRKVHVAHILLRTHTNMSATEKQAKLTAAQAAFSAVKSGKDFAKVASDFSEDTLSGKKGGDLGWVKEGAIDSKFSAQVFAMKPGDVSEPFETAFGFHIVKLLEGPATARQPLEAVTGDIRYQLRNQAKDTEVKRLGTLVNFEKKGS